MFLTFWILLFIKRPPNDISDLVLFLTHISKINFCLILMAYGFVFEHILKTIATIRKFSIKLRYHHPMLLITPSLTRGSGEGLNLLT